MHELLGYTYSPLSWSSCKSPLLSFMLVDWAQGVSIHKNFSPGHCSSCRLLGQKPVCQALSLGSEVYKYEHLHQVGTASRRQFNLFNLEGRKKSPYSPKKICANAWRPLSSSVNRVHVTSRAEYRFFKKHPQILHELWFWVLNWQKPSFS